MVTNVVSLFAGAGGMDLGAARAGLNIVAAYELDEAACTTYAKLVGDHIYQADLRKASPHSLTDADGIIAGPPCQTVSVSGKRNYPEDSRNLFPATSVWVLSFQFVN
jgi:DNA (cytosine-5)-methyltransferase 1